MKNTENGPSKETKHQEAKPSQWLRDAAERRELRGETAAAILFRNEAFRMEESSRCA